MRAYIFLVLLSLLLLTPAYVSFRRQMRRVKREILGIKSSNDDYPKDYIREDPGNKIRILGIPFIYVVIVIFLMWGVAVGYYVHTTILN